ncbi:MAG: SDR family oxidoreductase [Chloroflexi bacterium]|uniref:SDR family oxidoreductase n=1 Tax=Candidatus Flexifilum breve TaxID=3140694 RepID=UPI003136B706|nr:SDR family oxidoreductase [Chloroflexota bacterium]
MNSGSDSEIQYVLVTGVTGYIGGRLVPLLLEEGHQVRVLVRDSVRLQGRAWLEQVDVVQGDVLKPDTLDAALAGIDVAYYLIHSMRDGDDFHERDVRAARNFAAAAEHQGVKRIVYLGGLGDSATELSQHLRSRQQTGDALRESVVPVTEFRAGVIVGSGSLSFEMIRYLTERVPIMICPRWVYTRIQPIGIRDTLNYLVSALNNQESAGQIIEIGGAEVITYRDMMFGYARARGLRRYMIPVPVLTPRLSSYWVHWVTPIPGDIARPLIEGLRNEVVVRSDTARKLFPDIKPATFAVAVSRTLEKLEASEVETSWADALVSSQPDQVPTVLSTNEGMILEQRQQFVKASPGTVFRAFTSLGGANGWLYFNWAWYLRGILDRLVGGVGLRRGRRHPADVRVGDALDFWRVEAVERDKLLRLRAEMKVPGLAWLQFKAEPLEDGNTHLIQTAFFAPKGLFGLLYWYILYPLHSLIFSGMIRKLAQRAEDLTA